MSRRRHRRSGDDDGRPADARPAGPRARRAATVLAVAAVLVGAVAGVLPAAGAGTLSAAGTGAGLPTGDGGVPASDPAATGAGDPGGTGAGTARASAPAAGAASDRGGTVRDNDSRVGATVSGLVTDGANVPVRNATVYVAATVFPVSDYALRVVPVARDGTPTDPYRAAAFNLSLYRDLPGDPGVFDRLLECNTTVLRDTLDGDLRDSPGDGDAVDDAEGYDFDEFVRIDPVGFEWPLVTRTRPAPTEGTFTFERLVSPSDDRPTEYRVRAAAGVGAGRTLTVGTGEGRAAAADGVTDDANVVVDLPPGPRVRSLSVPDRVATGGRLTASVAVADGSAGGDGGGGLGNATAGLYLDADGDGRFDDAPPVATAALDVRDVPDGGVVGTATLAATVDLPPGEYRLAVGVGDAPAPRVIAPAGRLRVVSNVDRFAGPDGRVDAGDVLDAVAAHAADRSVAGRPVTARDVLAVVAAFGGQSPTDGAGATAARIDGDGARADSAGARSDG